MKYNKTRLAIASEAQPNSPAKAEQNLKKVQECDATMPPQSFAAGYKKNNKWRSALINNTLLAMSCYKNDCPNTTPGNHHIYKPPVWPLTS